jgi:hypothetical protein
VYWQPGDLVEWCFTSADGTSKGPRSKQGPRRVGIAVASVSSPKIIGRALSFAKRGVLAQRPSRHRSDLVVAVA